MHFNDLTKNKYEMSEQLTDNITLSEKMDSMKTLEANSEE